MLKFNSRLKPFYVEFACSPSVWVLSGYSGFLPLSKNMNVRLIGVSKIVPWSECERVCGCLSHSSLCDPVMDWWPVQGVPRLSPNDRRDRLQPPRDVTDRWKNPSLLLYSSSYYSLTVALTEILTVVGKTFSVIFQKRPQPGLYSKWFKNSFQFTLSKEFQAKTAWLLRG